MPDILKLLLNKWIFYWCIQDFWHLMISNNCSVWFFGFEVSHTLMHLCCSYNGIRLAIVQEPFLIQWKIPRPFRDWKWYEMDLFLFKQFQFARQKWRGNNQCCCFCLLSLVRVISVHSKQMVHWTSFSCRMCEDSTEGLCEQLADSFTEVQIARSKVK